MTPKADGVSVRFTDGNRPTKPLAIRSLSNVLIGGVLVASMIALLVSGRPLIGALPIVAGLTLMAVWWMPTRMPLYAVVTLAMLGDITTPVPIPADDPVLRPFQLMRLFLLENLNKATGVEALRVSGMEVALLLLVGLVLLRAFCTKNEDLRTPAAPVIPLYAVLGLAFVAVLAMEAWGLSRGGDARQSFWQLRYLLWTPLLGALSMYAIRRSTQLTEVAVLVTAVACLKVAVGLYIFMWARARGLEAPHSVTSHADTVLFTVVIALWSAVMLFRPTVTRALIALPAMLWMTLGIVINNRRTAYVSVFVVLLLLVFLLPRATRRAVMLGALAFAPFAAGYLLVGKSRSGTFFKPAAAIFSVTNQDDSSSDSRDVENYNLTLTLRHNLVLGSGFGHPYEEGPSSYDLSNVFQQYRYVAHNSVLWLMGIAGVFGFALFWMQYALVVHFAALAHRRATMSSDRIAAYTAIATIAAYQLQAWSDMGTQGWTTSVLVALAFAATSVVVRRTGAWPSSPFVLPQRSSNVWSVAKAHVAR